MIGDKWRIPNSRNGCETEFWAMTPYSAQKDKRFISRLGQIQRQVWKWSSRESFDYRKWLKSFLWKTEKQNYGWCIDLHLDQFSLFGTVTVKPSENVINFIVSPSPIPFLYHRYQSDINARRQRVGHPLQHHCSRWWRPHNHYEMLNRSTYRWNAGYFPIKRSNLNLNA